MGIFDQMIGAASSNIDQAKQDQFDQLKQKYHRALETLDQQGVRLQNLHAEDGKLVVIGAAPSEDAKNKVWDAIKEIDANYQDIQADITVDQSLGQGETETYTVQGGDSLWKIAQHKLGNGNRYMEIFYANRDKMDSPQSVIHPGDQLNIPKA
ncbi:MAG TPA: LysM peptidoglycan-binding domain-containing protein [Pyrinomonadaceae bacterium]|nr:LysM peptidoglycan-binding domain-containing protein [Pyrinomonadaceae bacterium]